MFALLSLLSPVAAAPIPVEVVRTDAGYALQRGGQPFTLRGVGGTHGLDQLVAIGGTSLRTWGVGEETAALLDEAHSLGLTVSLGIWLGHERHGFDYSDAAQVAAQHEVVRQAVMAHKDHPALLMWGLGNEMEGFDSGDDPAIWTAVCEAAALIQELDPHHPVMSTTADIGGGRVAALGGCAHIDIHGINSYGGAPSAPQRYHEAGGTKPIVFTEYGPFGVWEIGKTDFGAPPEQTSTDKAAAYVKVARAGVADPLVIGGYAFLWAWKTEATATWFGLFLPDGTRLAGVDALAEVWGSPVPDPVPVVTPLVSDQGDHVEPGAMVRVSWTVSDPGGQDLQTEWVLRREIAEPITGGDPQGLPASIPEAVVNGEVGEVKLKMPKWPGVYRLYATVRDDAGGGATASLPMLVGTPDPADQALPMPWYVYQDAGVGSPWVPTGHMGSLESFTWALDHQAGCASPPSCIRIESSGEGWSGVAWQTPAHNWGDHPGGADLSNARFLVFRVRGEFGWGTIRVGSGIVDEDKPHPDSLKVEKTVALTTEWQEVRVRLKGDRSHLVTGFWWVLPQQRPVTVYLDDIRFE
ncbi:MAG TPA: hypothetical protein DFR83_26115 [Deltaproteobacteria bacterium]|nr:hypothetical protein [Deltaproteobacteria bacterium]